MTNCGGRTRCMFPKCINMRELHQRLTELGAHFGDTVHGHNFSTESYVVGVRNGYYVIDLTKTILLLRLALRFIKKVSALGGRTVMYYYTGFQFDILTIFLSKLSKLFPLSVLSQRWIPGAISNYYSCFYDLINELQNLNWIDARKRVTFMSMFFRVLYFTSIDLPIDTTLEDQYSKSLSYWKAVVFIRHFKSYYCLPDSAICIDAPYSTKICQEFCSMGIPVSAPVNTRSDLMFISYPIISNNSSALLCIFYFSLFSSAIREGRRSNYMRLLSMRKSISFLGNRSRVDLSFRKAIHRISRRSKTRKTGITLNTSSARTNRSRFAKTLIKKKRRLHSTVNRFPSSKGVKEKKTHFENEARSTKQTRNAILNRITNLLVSLKKK